MWFRFRKLAFAAGALAGVVLVAMMTLWWRLASGPIEFDVATPWLTAAIEENFGSEHRVEVGGTQIERDANGRTALRIRDIVVRDADGTIVASAPKAEVGVSSAGLFTGRVRAQRLSLVGAEMQVRIEADSKVTIFAGANKRPFVTASVSSVPVRAGVPLPAPAERATVTLPAAPSARSAIPAFAALLAWIDSLGTTGLDGRDLSELGLKNGNLIVDDQRSGKQWTFQDINLSLTRPKAGSVALTVSSDDTERPWLLRAAITQGERGRRIVDIETKRLPAKDLMLAMRLGDGHSSRTFRCRRASARRSARRHSADGRRPYPGGEGTSSTSTSRSARSSSIVPSSPSIGMRRVRHWWCRSRWCRAAIASPVRPARRAA